MVENEIEPDGKWWWIMGFMCWLDTWYITLSPIIVVSPPPFKEGGGDTQFAVVDNPVEWSKFMYIPNHK